MASTVYLIIPVYIKYHCTNSLQCKELVIIKQSVFLPSENSSVEVTESRLCWSLLSESLRSGSGAAHAPPGCSAAHDDEEEEEGAWWTSTVSAWRWEEDEEDVDGRQKSKSLWWRVLLGPCSPTAPRGGPSDNTIGTRDSEGTGFGGREGGGPEDSCDPLLP